MTNLLLWIECDKQLQTKCATMKRLISTLANRSACERCVKTMKGIVDLDDNYTIL